MATLVILAPMVILALLLALDLLEGALLSSSRVPHHTKSGADLHRHQFAHTRRHQRHPASSSCGGRRGRSSRCAWRSAGTPPHRVDSKRG
jgi:hypothetical protein